MSATRRFQRSQGTHKYSRAAEIAAAPALEKQVLEFSDQILALGERTVDGPAIAITGCIEAMCRLAVMSGVPNVRAVVLQQVTMMLDELIPMAEPLVREARKLA